MDYPNMEKLDKNRDDAIQLIQQSKWAGKTWGDVMSDLLAAQQNITRAMKEISKARLA